MPVPLPSRPNRVYKAAASVAPFIGAADKSQRAIFKIAEHPLPLWKIQGFTRCNPLAKAYRVATWEDVAAYCYGVATDPAQLYFKSPLSKNARFELLDLAATIRRTGGLTETETKQVLTNLLALRAQHYG